jgi:WD40 repeat protein/serine/threonine protein kinase
MSQLIGNTLGPYQVMLHIRSTHMDAIYKAFDTRRGQYVALQVILPDQDRPERLLAYLQEHGEALKKLSYAHIGTLLDCAEYEDYLCLAYDFIPRGVLRRRFNRNMTWTQAARTLIPIAEALAYAHLRGMIHGHLRPSSILIGEDNTPYVFDFGVEQIITECILADTPGTWLGSDFSSYLAPEQVLGRPADNRSDIYSFAMVFYELVTGRRAFQGETTLAEIIHQYTTPLVPPQKVIKEIPETASLILEKALAADPNQRFQDMQHIHALLGRMVLNQPVSIQMVRNPGRKPRKPLPPMAWAGIALGCVLLVALGFLGYLQANPAFARRMGIFPTPPPTVLAAASPPTSAPTVTPTGPFVTAAPQTKAPEATATLPLTARPTRAPEVFVAYPVLANTPVPQNSGAITLDNARRMTALSRLGIGELFSIAWSPIDGSKIAIASSTGVYVIDSQKDDLLLYLDTASVVYSVAFSPDEKLLATGEKDGLVHLWDATNGQEIAPLSGHEAVPVRRVIFSPDGMLLVSVADDATALLWDVPQKQLIRVFSEKPGGKTHTQRVTSAVFSPDGSLVATTSADFYLKLWNVKDGQKVLSLNAGQVINDAAFTKDGKTLLIGGGFFTVQVWDVATGLQQKPLTTTTTATTELKISPDGKLVAIGNSAGQVKVLDLQGKVQWSGQNTNLPRQGDTLPEYPHSLAFSPDSTRLASGIWDDTIRIWDSTAGTEERAVTWLAAYNTGLAISPDGKTLAVQSIGDTVHVWDLPKAQSLYTISGSLTSGRIFSYDSARLAVRKNADSLTIYSLADGQEVFTFNGNQDLRSISFSKDGAFLIAGRDGKIHLWSLSSGQQLLTNTNFGLNGCTVIWDRTGRQIAYSTRYSYLDLVDAGNTKLCEVTPGGWMRVLFFQKDGQMFAAGGSSNLEIWDYRSGSTGVSDTSVRMEKMTGLSVDSLAISEDGSLLAAATSDQTIYIFDAKTGRRIIALEGHQATITGLAFTPDDGYLVSTSLDGTIRIWGVK